MIFAEKPILYNISSRTVIELHKCSTEMQFIIHPLLYTCSSTNSSALAVCNTWLHETKTFQWSGCLLWLLFKVLSRPWSDFWWVEMIISCVRVHVCIMVIIVLLSSWSMQYYWSATLFYTCSSSRNTKPSVGSLWNVQPTWMPTSQVPWSC